MWKSHFRSWSTRKKHTKWEIQNVSMIENDQKSGRRVCEKWGGRTHVNFSSLLPKKSSTMNFQIFSFSVELFEPLHHRLPFNPSRFEIRVHKLHSLLVSLLLIVYDQHEKILIDDRWAEATHLKVLWIVYKKFTDDTTAAAEAGENVNLNDLFL